MEALYFKTVAVAYDPNATAEALLSLVGESNNLYLDLVSKKMAPTSELLGYMIKTRGLVSFPGAMSTMRLFKEHGLRPSEATVEDLILVGT